MKQEKNNTAAGTQTPPEGEEEVRRVRHTISSEETFTLAKDIYDLRCVIKKIYSNRAQIARRLNLLSFVFSLAFTAIYVAIILYLALAGTLSFGWEVAVYVIFGVYVALAVALCVCAYTARRSTTKSIARNSRLLKIFRYAVRVASLAMSIAALSVTGALASANSMGLAMQTVAIVVSIISIILSLIPLVFGGLGGVARWLLSPTKVNKKFAPVVLEWYQSATSSPLEFASTQKIEKSKLEEIGRCVDSYILPVLGNRKVGSIGTTLIFAAVDEAAESDRATVEGILKNVFDYAVECKYVPENPCRDMQLQGSIEVPQKPKKEPLRVRLGKKIGSSIIKQFLGENKDDGGRK